MIGPCDIGGVEGHAISLAGENLLAVVSRAFAPGAPFRGVVRLGDAEISIDGRTIGCKRTPEGSFEVRVRLISLRKADRERLEAASRGA